VIILSAFAKIHYKLTLSLYCTPVTCFLRENVDSSEKSRLWCGSGGSEKNRLITGADVRTGDLLLSPMCVAVLSTGQRLRRRRTVGCWPMCQRGASSSRLCHWPASCTDAAASDPKCNYILFIANKLCCCYLDQHDLVAVELFDTEYYRDLEMWVRGHSRSLKMVSFESFGTVSYSPSIVTMAVSLVISEIFTVKEWPDHEVWVWGSYKVVENSAVWYIMYDFLLVRHCDYSLSCIVTLKSGLDVTQGQWNWCHSKAWVRFPLRLL